MLLKTIKNSGLTGKILSDYGYLLSGQVGRLIFSVVYFVTLARTLSLSDFGLFATASAIGVVLSRVSGFGFISPLYRVATTKPQLIGTFTAGYMAAVVASLPLVILLASGIYLTLYANSISAATFAWILAAEILFWRSLEVVIIILNGRKKFGLGSGITIFGTANKAIAALGMACFGINGLEDWAIIYALTNLAFAMIAVGLFYPKQRLRWRPKIWLARLQDALSVSAAEVLFYIQSELDKILVLAFGGETTAGIYAIIMRLIDLTALPLRSLNTMLVQWIMHRRQSRQSSSLSFLLDGGIALVSTAGLLGIWLLLLIASPYVGDNIALGSTYLMLVLLVPGFRNCIEYHSDLLYAHEKTFARAVLLALLGAMKAILLAALLLQSKEFSDFALWLNLVFGVLYATSALLTYRFILNQKSTHVESQGLSR